MKKFFDRKTYVLTGIIFILIMFILYKTFYNFFEKHYTVTKITSVNMPLPTENCAPVISSDGLKLYFLSNRTGSTLGSGGLPSFDFWYSVKSNCLDPFTDPPILVPSSLSPDNTGLNTKLDEGPGSVSADGNTIYFTAKRPDGTTNYQLYKVDKNGTLFGTATNIGLTFSNNINVGQPCITADKKRIYFVSDSLNGLHIWYSDSDDGINYKPPVQITKINSAGRELSPFMCSDGVTLYFASNGLTPNYGGFDIYKTTFDRINNVWTDTVNLGPEINSSLDDMYPSRPTCGSVFYFARGVADTYGFRGFFDFYQVTPAP